MRTTIFDVKERIYVEDGKVMSLARPLISTWIKENGLERQWMPICTIMKHAFTHELHPTGIELHVGSKFILDAELDDLTDELDALIIERFDELRMNFGEVARIRLVALSQ
jgi:hypothetical protein